MTTAAVKISSVGMMTSSSTSAPVGAYVVITMPPMMMMTAMISMLPSVVWIEIVEVIGDIAV